MLAEAKRQIVIVDDHPLFRLGFISLLSQICPNYHTREAGNVSSFLRILANAYAEVDLVILDINIPGTDISGAIDTARTYLPDVRIVALVECYNEAIAARLLQKGLSGIILKSAEQDQVEATIRAVLQKGFCFGSGTPDIDYRKVFKENRRKSLSYVDLSDRELQVIKLIVEEKTTEEIGSILAISPRTVEGYRKRILVKTSSKNTAGIVLFAVQNRIVEISTTLAYVE
jgi:two-component system response regulator DegU